MAQAAAWLGVPPDHLFGLAALPYGSYTAAHHAEEYRVGVAIGDCVLDLTTATERLLAGRAPLFASGSLDDFMAAGERCWAQIRAELIHWLSYDQFRPALEDLLIPATAVSLRLPFTVADYVDFYASAYHASNIGQILRPGTEPLTPNWKHLPIGYHGRAGTVVVSGTEIRRPCGQSRPPGARHPSFGPCTRLDFEAELGFVVGAHSHLGDPVPVDRFAEHVFGVCLVNDWSARDIQGWEYVPLGPFLGKSFATTVSPWVLPLAALDQARLRPPSRDAKLLGYLTETTDWGLDITFEVRLNGHVIARPPYGSMFWSPAQMLAHMTVNGACTRTGDLFASGTVSGPEPAERGSLIELAWNGSNPVPLPDGSVRSWLEDGDEVTITAVAAGADGTRIGLGSASGCILPAISESAEGHH
ncbi:MAG TPA: fumarylacetoacetase [Streptosporangiaceae bacterium]|nr:fumarylacetoacetase [Streptosporangiaceae bacterium]